MSSKWAAVSSIYDHSYNTAAEQPHSKLVGEQKVKIFYIVALKSKATINTQTNGYKEGNVNMQWPTVART